jgi:hypothetical protein
LADNGIVRRRLLVLVSLGVLLAPPADAHASPRIVTVATGSDVGGGPSARLKAWRDDPRGRLCFQLTIPYRAMDGERYVARRLTCAPYPPRRSLTYRVAAFDCTVGGRLLVGIVSDAVARVEVANPTRGSDGSPREARTFRSADLGAGVVYAGLEDFNAITTRDAAGRELKRTEWSSPYPGCPSFARQLL